MTPRLSDDELMALLREGLERLDPAPPAAWPDPALLARVARQGARNSRRAAPPVAALRAPTPVGGDVPTSLRPPTGAPLRRWLAGWLRRRDERRAANIRRRMSRLGEGWPR